VRTLFVSRNLYENSFIVNRYLNKHVTDINKTSVSILAVIIIAATIIAPFLSTVAGEVVTSYGGTTTVYDPPYVTFSADNGSILYNSGNLTLGLTASIGLPVLSKEEPDTLQTLLVALTSVSYKASWLNQPLTLYTWRINNPANLSQDDPNPLQTFSYSLNLTGISKGPQQIEVTVVGGGAVWGPSGYQQVTYSVFSTNGSSTLNFTVEASQAKSLEPFATAMAIAVVSTIAVVVIIVSLLLYRRHEKTIK
jgi:hypothetical protein